ncbi:tetraspanin-17 isoform X4 [Pan paniscus]|uniref:tetraspanin-17 isoform X4 n=1 Tax=Pan paniscus TaxID=9597 RepID=UPI0004F015F6|nr:tetraspanin-17 isoform X4 [Pan paniscus]
MPGKHQHFQEPEVGCCGKYFLFGFNIVFWVLGALFLAIGLWAWGEKGVLSNISALTDLGGLDPVWLFVVVGGVMSVLGFAGCIGALRENTFLLKFFSVFLGLIFFLELATGILAFVFKDWIRDQLNLFINNNVKAYRDDIDLQNLIDFAQEYEDVLNTQCGYDVRLKLVRGELEQQGFIHTKGCVGQFEKWLQDNLIVVAGVFMGIALLQIFGICLAQNLVSDIKAVKANWSKWNDDFENHWLTPTISEVLSTAGPQQNSLIGAPGPAPPSRHVFFGLGGLYPEPTFKNW